MFDAFCLDLPQGAARQTWCANFTLPVTVAKFAVFRGSLDGGPNKPPHPNNLHEAAEYGNEAYITRMVERTLELDINCRVRWKGAGTALTVPACRNDFAHATLETLNVNMRMLICFQALYLYLSHTHIYMHAHVHVSTWKHVCMFSRACTRAHTHT